MKKIQLSILLPFIGSLSTPAWADQTEPVPTTPNTMRLQEVVVSATRTETSIASIPGSVQVINEEQIRQQTGAGRRVADILGQLVPGISPSTGGMSNFGQTLRGRNTLILIDGVSQNATRDNFRQLNSIAPESIERIEVVSGASSVYGAGASGGIINIITKRNKGEELAFSSKIGMTTGNNLNNKGFSYDAFQSATGRKDALDWYVSANTVQRNDQFDGNGNRIPQDTSQGSNMDTSTYDLQGRFGYALDADKKISLSLQDYKGQQVESYWRRADALFFPDLSRGLAGISDNNSVQDVYGLRAALESKMPDIGPATGTLVWGADYDHETSRQRGDQYTVNGLTYTKTGTTFEMGPDTVTATKAIFGQLSYDIGDWTLRGGVRREWIESEISDSIAYGEIVQTGNRATLPGGTLNYNDTLYNLGAVYHLNENQDVFVNFSQGFSLPDIQRFLRDVSSTYNIHDLNAQAIKVNSYELGWRGNWDKWQASVTAYENTSDVTQFYDANNRVLRLLNQKERVRGAETTLTYNVTDQGSVGGTYAYAKGETNQNGKWIDLPATRISPAKTTAFVGYDRGDYNLRLQGMRLADYDAAFKDNNGRDIKGYTLFDMLGSVALPVGRLEGGVYNLANRNYQNMFAQANARAPFPNAQGRTFSVSYAVDW